MVFLLKLPISRVAEPPGLNHGLATWTALMPSGVEGIGFRDMPASAPIFNKGLRFRAQGASVGF